MLMRTCASQSRRDDDCFDEAVILASCAWLSCARCICEWWRHAETLCALQCLFLRGLPKRRAVAHCTHERQRDADVRMHMVASSRCWLFWRDVHVRST